MRKGIKIILTICITVFGFIGLLYYSFINADFVGVKDPKVVEENLKRWENTILKAEYKGDSNFCEVELLDSSNIQINVGDKKGYSILELKYKFSKDTIIVDEGIKHANQYLNSKKFIIKNDKILFLTDSIGNFDTIKTLKIKFNKMEKE